MELDYRIVVPMEAALKKVVDCSIEHGQSRAQGGRNNELEDLRRSHDSRRTYAHLDGTGAREVLLSAPAKLAHLRGLGL